MKYRKDTSVIRPEEPGSKVDLEETFGKEGLENIMGFLGCLKDIQDRLLREGYTIVRDEFVPPDK